MTVEPKQDRIPSPVTVLTALPATRQSLFLVRCRQVKVIAAIGRLVRHANPFVFIPALWPQRNLVAQLTWREVRRSC